MKYDTINITPAVRIIGPHKDLVEVLTIAQELLETAYEHVEEYAGNHPTEYEVLRLMEIIRYQDFIDGYIKAAGTAGANIQPGRDPEKEGTK